MGYNMEEFLDGFNELTAQIDPEKEKKLLERTQNKQKKILEAQKRMKETRHERQKKKRLKKQQERAEMLSKMTTEERKEFIKKERTVKDSIKEVDKTERHIFLDLSFNHLMSESVILLYNQRKSKV
eukprot:TRINITY_DN12908_c0_g1_i1.p1 TRINITY_DN12908_c0_g1~~TRINITY_DN12908_c0_g1_i1.p1  ORF type:complete len:126 (+),score=22.70 TRINITY_DN12908_c0_g1_i1:97-474(+)